MPRLTDPLFGAMPSWRAHEEPIYLEMVADFGPPGLDVGPGEILEAE